MARTVALLVLLVLPVAAQSPPPAGPRFTVVSIRQNTSGPAGGGLRVNPGGQFQWTNVTLRALVGTVFQRYGFDMRESIGGPAWIDSARFDVIAQTGSGVPANDADGFPGPTFAMIRAMLEERFGVATHNEVREAPIYRLVQARRDSSLGPGLRRLTFDCSRALNALVAGAQADLRQGRGPDCTFGGPPGRLQGNVVTLDMLARVIGRQLNRPTFNATSIAGHFDVDLTFSPDVVQDIPGRQPGDPLPTPTDAPSIFTAVQEQLGLRLESARGPVDVLVIDKAHMPTKN